MTTSPSKPLSVPAQPIAQTPVKSQKSTNTSASAASTAPKSDTGTPASTSTPTPATKSTVRISAAALAALQESRETPAQTAAEARGGDAVAKNLVAKQQARAAEFKGN